VPVRQGSRVYRRAQHGTIAGSAGDNGVKDGGIVPVVPYRRGAKARQSARRLWFFTMMHYVVAGGIVPNEKSLVFFEANNCP